MKGILLKALLLLVPLSLALTLDISAQQNAGAGKSTMSPNLESLLDQLGRELKESVVIEPRRWGGVRRTYVRLKHRGGCNITFQVSIVPSSPNANQPNRTPPDLSTAEWRVNLSDLDIAQLTIETPAIGDFRVMRFATIGGKESIEWKGFAPGDVGRMSGGWIYIGRSGLQAAAALEQAIIACRE